jgi:DNA-3-methyladenine glycosylase II
MRRFRVAEDSMLPTLAPGDEFVTTLTRPPAIGDIVALPHPDHDDFWLVKRLAAGPGDRVDGLGVVPEGKAWVLSDNRAESAHDSRSFGPVPLSGLQPRIDRLDEVTFIEAIELLAVEEPPFSLVVEELGKPIFWQRSEGFATLAWLILEQQVSLESGAAMFRRVLDLLGRVTPEAVMAAGVEPLRSIGVTRQKAAYLLDLAVAVAGGNLDLEGLFDAGPGEARRALLAMHGIGPWTADAYLLSALRLPDVFPVGDRALQVGTAEILGMSSVPDPEQLEMLSMPWRPVRAAAARLIWHSYLMRRGRVEPAAPPP